MRGGDIMADKKNGHHDHRNNRGHDHENDRVRLV
jgi:hypothetical protein